MNIVDQFDIENCTKEPLLEYVFSMVLAHLPDVDVNDEGEPELLQSLSSLYLFVERYNNKSIDYHFKYDDYINGELGKDIHKTLSALNIDSEKFWYLLLFVYDFSYGKCIDGRLINESPFKQIQNLVDAVFANSTINDKSDLTFIKESKLTLNIKGKYNVVIDNQKALTYIVSLCNEGLKRVENGSIMKTSMVKIEQIKIESTSVHICFIAMMLTAFLKDNIVGNPKKKKGEVVSLSRLELISRLIYFTKISTNKKLLEGDNILKQCLKEYKDHETKTMNSIYYSCWNN